MEKNLNYTNFEETANANMSTETYVDVNGYQVVVKHRVGIAEIIRIVNSVSDACFIGDEYISGVVDVLTKNFVIKEFTNIDVPEDVEQICAFIYGTDVWNVARGIIDPVQLDVIERSIRKKIEYIINMRGDSINNKCLEFIIKMSDVSDKMNELFDGIEKSDISNILTAISNSKISETKLMRAYTKEKK